MRGFGDTVSKNRITALHPCDRCFGSSFFIEKKNRNPKVPAIGAVDEIRTRDIHLGKVALYH